MGNVTIITSLAIGSLKISVIKQAFCTTDKRTAIDKVARILKISNVYLAVHYISDVFVDLVKRHNESHYNYYGSEAWVC